MILTKYSCSKCNTVLKSWDNSFGFGNPFIMCPKCNLLVRVGTHNEWEAMNFVQRGNFLFTIYFQGLYLGIAAVVFLILILEKFFEVKMFREDNLVLIILLCILGASLWTYSNHKDFIKGLEKSKERTKDINYRKLLKIK